MTHLLRPIYAFIAASALIAAFIAHPANADSQPDVRAQGLSLALATANAAISVNLNFGRQLIHWQIVTGATTNAADRLIFENSADAGTTWDGATVLQSSSGTGTSTVLNGTIAAGATFTPAASTTYNFWVPVNAMTATRVRVSTNHAGDSAATVAYSATAGAVPAPLGPALTVNTPAPVPTGPNGGVAVQAATYGHTVQVNPNATAFAVKTTAGILGGVQFWNGAGVTNFLQIFDNVAGSITLGTTAHSMLLACTATTMCFFPVPASGIAMGTGITMYCTTTATGSTGCATGTEVDVDYL